MDLKRVVVTGLGAITPLGKTVETYWQGLSEGVNGCDLIKQFDASKFKTRFACEIKNFDVHQFIEKSEARRFDPYTQYALVAVEEAVKQAGINFDALNKNRIGVIWGSGNGGIQTFQDQVMEFALGDGTPRFNPFFIPKMILQMAGFCF